METKLHLISEIAEKDPKCRFSNLTHLLNAQNLRACFYDLRRKASAGVDGVSFAEYEQNLESNLENLVSRMKTFSYHPQPALRVYIPKANGGQRPLGIPSLEDKIVQTCIAKILTAIYEKDFLSCSYGFRPGRSCHDALNKLDKIIMVGPINHVIDADIRGFFDNVDHEWMLRCLRERISDEKLLRYVVRFLKAGVMESGKWLTAEQGTPQGGNLSPILANIYLHYVLDLWIDRRIRRQSRGKVEMVRFADDFVICVRYKDDALRIHDALHNRLGKFGLEISAEKTKVIEFGRYARQNARKKGQKPGTFTFLGLTHYCDKTRKGKFKVGRTTDRKKFRDKIRNMNEWLKSVRSFVTVKEWWPILCAKLRGHFQYYGVSGNYGSISKFYYLTVRQVFKWMNRRSQRKSFNWETFKVYLNRHPLPKPRICHNFYTLGR